MSWLAEVQAQQSESKDVKMEILVRIEVEGAR
jgi:hypothetical protein